MGVPHRHSLVPHLSGEGCYILCGFISSSSSFSSSWLLRASALSFATGPQPRSSAPSVRYRTSTAIICAQCSLPDLNRNHLRPVFAADPQPRSSARSVRCRTSTAILCAQCSLLDLNRDHLRRGIASRKNVRRAARKTAKSKCTKHVMGGPFFEVAMWKNCTPL